MPTIEDRLRDTGRVWRDYVDATALQEHSTRTPTRGRAPKRRVVLIAAAAVVVAAAVPVAGVLAHRGAEEGGGGGIAASCAGPRLQLVGKQKDSQIAVAHAGQELTVTGRFFLDSCNDTNPQLNPTPRPLTLALTLRHGSHVVQLRTVHAHGELGTFRTAVRIPVDFPTGAAQLSTHTPGSQRSWSAGAPMEPIRLTIVK